MRCRAGWGQEEWSKSRGIAVPARLVGNTETGQPGPEGSRGCTEGLNRSRTGDRSALPVAHGSVGFPQLRSHSGHVAFYSIIIILIS